MRLSTIATPKTTMLARAQPSQKAMRHCRSGSRRSLLVVTTGRADKISFVFRGRIQGTREQMSAEELDALQHGSPVLALWNAEALQYRTHSLRL